jgi:hypothetical protein
VDENGRAMGGRRFEHGLDPFVFQTIPVHGGKQGHDTHAQVAQGTSQSRVGVRGERIEHENADEPRRMPGDGGGH